MVIKLTYLFFKVFHEKSAQTDFSKEMWVSILKGLKHLNTVLRSSGRGRGGLEVWVGVEVGIKVGVEVGIHKGVEVCVEIGVDLGEEEMVGYR